ncbi:MAG: hypothetical protein CW346_01370 [Bacillaceae bacterium]|nr:hypothetical protein [Bacillaceae bacterium]
MRKCLSGWGTRLIDGGKDFFCRKKAAAEGNKMRCRRQRPFQRAAVQSFAVFFGKPGRCPQEGQPERKNLKFCFPYQVY